MATGAVQYVLGGAGYNVPISIVTGGTWGEDGQPQVRSGIGGVGVVLAGPALPKVALNLMPTNAACLLGSVLRTVYPTGAPPNVPLEVGDNEWGEQLAAWKIDTAEIACEVEGALTANYAMIGAGKPTETAGGASYTPVKTTYEWYRGSVTVGGAAYSCRAISFSVANGLIPVYSLDDKVAASLRYPDSIDVGPEVVTADAEYWADPDHDLSGDDLPTATLVLIAVNNAYPASTVTVTGTSMKVVSWETGPVDSNAQKIYKASYALDHNSAAFTITVA